MSVDAETIMGLESLSPEDRELIGDVTAYASAKASQTPTRFKRGGMGDAYHRNPVDFDRYNKYRERRNSEDRKYSEAYKRNTLKRAVSQWYAMAPEIYRDATLASIGDRRPLAYQGLRKAITRVQEMMADPSVTHLPNLVIAPGNDMARGKTYVAYAYLNFLVARGIITDPARQLFITTQDSLYEKFKDYTTKREIINALEDPLHRVIMIDGIYHYSADWREKDRIAMFETMMSMVPGDVSVILVFNHPDVTVPVTDKDNTGKDYYPNYRTAAVPFTDYASDSIISAGASLLITVDPDRVETRATQIRNGARPNPDSRLDREACELLNITMPDPEPEPEEKHAETVAERRARRNQWKH